MVFGIDDALMAAGIQAAGSAVGGYLSGKGNAPKETKIQKQQRYLIDELLKSLSGNGAYADLFNQSDEAFNKSFVEPAKAMFQNQIAPQIQQQFIANGQQRSSGLEGQLTRAGVDLDSMLNQYMYQHQQDALNRKSNTLNSILGAGAGAPNETSSGQDIMSGLGGYLSSTGFADTLAGFTKGNSGQVPMAKAGGNIPPRKGFEPEWKDYKLGDPRWSY